MTAFDTPFPFTKSSHNTFEVGFCLILPFLGNRRLEVLLDGKSSRKYSANPGVSQGFILGPALFLLLTIFLVKAIGNIAVYTDENTLYSKTEQTTELSQQLKLISELELDLRDTVDWKWLVNFNARTTD